MRKALTLTTAMTGALAAALWRAPTPPAFAVAERTRLRAHFDSVERELRARDVPGLTPARRAARARVLDLLHAYQQRGVFPRNTDFPDRDVPVFIDWRGTRCGFAYLVEQTGHEDVVLRIAATRNYARVPELKDDPDVRRWLADNGITLAEATRIQPSYGCGGPSGDCAVSGATFLASDGYKVATGVAVGTNVASFTLNVLHTGLSRQATGIASLGAGAVGIIAGAPNLGTAGPRGTLGLLNAGVGTASLALGAIRLIGTAHPATPSRVSLGPWFGARGTSGLAARVEF
jgi:hypothetical protein